jgi:hypothetical protein
VRPHLHVALAAASGLAVGGVLRPIGASVLTDTLSMTGIWDRSEEYDPLPLSMFVIALYVPAATFGVALRGAAQGRPLRAVRS